MHKTGCISSLREKKASCTKAIKCPPLHILILISSETLVFDLHFISELTSI